jgi:rubrerythrin
MNEQKEIKLTMENVCLLELCATIEDKCAELYRIFAELYVDIPELASLWTKTANEEDNHAEQFKLAVRLKGQGKVGVKADVSKVTNIVEKIDAFIPIFKNSKPTPIQALKFAIQLEESLAEYHMHNLIIFTDDNLKLLFISMAQNDNCHIEMLRKALHDIQEGLK